MSSSNPCALHARKLDGSRYPPATINLILCGLQRHMRRHMWPSMPYFDKHNPQFHGFHGTMDSVYQLCIILTMMHSFFITIVTFCYRIFLGAIEPYCLKHWDEETILSDFIKPQRKAYANVLQGKLLSKGRINNLTIEGTVASVIAMVYYVLHNNYILFWG